MLDGTPASLLMEWMAYFQIEPFGEERADLRNAITCQTIAGAMGLKKKGGGDFKITDFMPDFEKKKRDFMDPMTALKTLQKLIPKKQK